VAYPRDKNGDLLVSSNINNDKTLQNLLNVADTNSDGLISFEEYIFFTSLLTCDIYKMQLTFKLFDKNGDGVLNKEELNQALNKNNSKITNKK
jgi:Ca2+-binding EF-hand superfamily protein